MYIFSTGRFVWMKAPDEEWHPYFIEALQKLDKVEYQLDTILARNLSDRAFFIKDYERAVTEMEERIRNYRSDMVRRKGYQQS